MGRQPNFSELREAIRQGQLKIKQGLETGQMRSDRIKNDDAPKPRLDLAHEVLGKKSVLNAEPASEQKTPLQNKKPDFLVKKPRLTEKVALFVKSKDLKSRFKMPKMPRPPKMPPLPKMSELLSRLPKRPRVSPSKVRSMLYGMVAVLVAAVVIVVIYGIGKALKDSPATPSPVVRPGSPIKTVMPEPPQPTVQRAPVPVQIPRQELPPQPVEPPKPAPVATAPAVKTGNNVIVIQYITTSREKELLPVQEFFTKNGVATEIFRRGGGSYVVTRDRFENPNRPGTDGHAMLLKIREVGKRYPVETGDRQFGTFQDAYGMLKQ